MSKICRNFENSSGNYRFSNFRQIWVPLIGTPKNNRRDKFLTNFEFRAILNAVRGRRVRNVSVASQTKNDPVQFRRGFKIGPFC